MLISKKILVLLPHLDDEFALIPFLKKIASRHDYYIHVIYCAERINKKENLLVRRKENIKALIKIGINIKDIIYLNDYFEINDLELYKSSQNIYNFVKSKQNYINYNQIVTLNLEGGHPDHDALAMIVEKIIQKTNIKVKYFPAYNYERTFFFLPVKVVEPLKIQKKYFKHYKLRFFDWSESIKCLSAYRSEKKAIIKLLPFLIFKTFFSQKIWFSIKIDKDSVNWKKSLTQKNYNVAFEEISRHIGNIL